MTHGVPFNDLTRLSQLMLQEIESKVLGIIKSGPYILSEEVSAFENELAAYIGCDEAVGVASGTDALILSLLAAEVGSGDIVLTMANAGSYTTVAAKAVGAEPVFVEISSETLQVTLEEILRSVNTLTALGLHPKAIVVTHLFGQLNSEMQEIATYANENGFVLIEDCAQSIGALMNGKSAGSFGDLSTFSFYPTKNLGALGDGGAVSGNNSQMLSKVGKLRQYGWESKYSIETPLGRNSRLDEIQASILRIKLRHVSDWNEKRRQIYARYQESAGNSVQFFGQQNASFVAHLCPIIVNGKTQDQLIEHFLSLGISASIHFPVPDHKQKIELAYRDLIDLSTTELACASLVTIPLFPELTDIEIQKVCNALSELGK
jgi:aminotransferase EvaB